MTRVELRNLVLQMICLTMAALPLPFFLLQRLAEGGNGQLAGWLMAGLLLVFALLAVLFAAAAIKRAYRKAERVDWLLGEAVSGNPDRLICRECSREDELLLQDAVFARLYEDVRETALVLADQEKQRQRDMAYLKDLMSDISHQMKTPLAALEIYTDIFRREMKDTNPEAEELSGRADAAMERMRWLVTGMLKLAQLESGTYILEKKKLPLKDTLEKSIHALEELYRKKGLKIKLFGDVEEAQLLQDRDWLQEAFQNILKNAIEYADEQSVVGVEIHATPMSVMVSITDHGEGIPEEEVPKIFNRFYRAKRENGRRSEGVGIGLALARQIIEAHGGSLTAQSRCGEGAYTTLIATFLTEL